jgi:predicted metal-binding integral membrane protein DUF2182
VERDRGRLMAVIDGPVTTPARFSPRRLVAGHPEWWVRAVAGSAWLVLAWMSTGMSMSTGGFAAAWSAGWSHWVLMVLAMMLLVVAPRVRTVALGSPSSRRHRSAGAYVLGFVTLWSVVGAALVGAVVLAGVEHHGGHLLPLVLLLAAAWQVSVPRRRVLRRSWPLRPRTERGLAGDIDCARSGVRSAARCLVECWPVMLAMALSHSLLLMAGLTVVLLSERWGGPDASRRAGRPLEAWVLAGFALVALVAMPPMTM